MTFKTDYNTLLEQLDQIDPLAYGKTRNFIDGAVTRLSPYISRGVISTKMVMAHVLDRGYNPYHIEKFLQELAWRDYWQQVWIEKGHAINADLKREQPEVEHHEISENLVASETGIVAIDQSIAGLYDHGYMHNHLRMYVASIACNVGKAHWKAPAQWMYYHLIDGDWASNALSWQWVAGANANKKYYANQDNINKYCYTNQRNSFLNVSYEAFESMDIPETLRATTLPTLETPLPEHTPLQLDTSRPLMVYNYYNLDPLWRQAEAANRVLLIEPSVFQQYPISQNAIDFMLQLAKNIPGIQIFVGEFNELQAQAPDQPIYYKEHPLNRYQGHEDPRDWMFPVKGYFPSFFSFWKKCRKTLK